MRPSQFFALIPCLASAALAAPAGTPWAGVVLPARQAELPAAVAGRVAELKVKEGEAVKAGQLLVRLEQRLEELELQRTKAVLQRREFEAKGAKKLFEGKVIPEAQALEARLELELARVAAETAAEQVRLRSLTAPFDGVVVDLRREVGEAVTAGQPLLRLVDLQRVLVRCEVAPEELGGVAPGRKVTVRIPQAEGTSSVPGEVLLVDSCAAPSGRYRVQITVENPEGRIRAGLPARVELAEAAKEKPATAN